jgi:hypothetical protein
VYDEHTDVDYEYGGPGGNFSAGAAGKDVSAQWPQGQIAGVRRQIKPPMLK